MVIHPKWPVEHEAKTVVFDEVAHFLHNLLASRYSPMIEVAQASQNSS